MADANDLYKDDLYGDLDLEDLDASQLEELVEPPELEPVPTATTSSQPPPITHSLSAPVSAPYQQAGGFPGQQQQQQQQQLQQQDDGGLDRIRPSDMPDEGKMFIGGLNWETTDEGLKAYMAQFGEIDACTIMRDLTGRSRGFAFLTYRNPSSVTKVMSQNHHLDGKQIDPKRAIPRAEHERTAKVFVGGLAPSVNGESLKIFLTQFGQVMDATVMFDKETGRSKGFAFATFADEDAVGRAMAASGIELDGKQIEIKKAQPRGAGTQPGKFGGPQGGRFGQNNNTGFNPALAGGAAGFAGNSLGGMGGVGAGGFDPNAMAMMYQNMMKGPAMGGMMGGFDPNSMAMMYQNMMKSMAGGGMGNAPAINPNMAMRNGGIGMGGMGMGGMGMGMGMGMGGMMGGMGGMGMGMGGGGGGMGSMNRPMGGSSARPIPNAPRGPAAMRTPAPASGSATGGTTPGAAAGGTGAQRYSTQGSARSKPY
ncbi:hypothetical protein IAR55_005668 [Kwoniella newhampshirensis]|uniref:RRM domain-containing protein n=1 Tax=Kwoniella newhampshirensis TaxID=1651941 RepID=A0AAW0YKL3_9TREE